MSDDPYFDSYLNGEITQDELPEAVRREERELRELMGALHVDIEASHVLRNNVMREIESVGAPFWRSVVDWCVRPRTIRLSPAAGGLALAASAAIAILVVGVLPMSDMSDTGGVEVAAEQVVTRFVFIAPEASVVQVTGDFIDWSPDGLALENERGTGVWTIDVPLEPGVYQYAFVVDGVEWRPDPRAVSHVDDGFGRENSVVIVSRASAS
jgi:hypothetical protein